MQAQYIFEVGHFKLEFHLKPIAMVILNRIVIILVQLPPNVVRYLWSNEHFYFEQTKRTCHILRTECRTFQHGKMHENCEMRLTKLVVIWLM